jgi:hypothetical protein|tara:strand:+ start:162 stop:590 length:429 start_codon:yes stop_codon:yes gene_type:complete
MIKTIQPKTMHGEGMWEQKEILKMTANVIDSGHMGKATAKSLTEKHNEIEEAISSWYQRLDLHRTKMMASEVEIAKICKSTSVNVRSAANHLGEGLARLEKTCNFDRLERHVELLERASVAMLSLSELEKNGRLEKIMDAMK